MLRRWLSLNQPGPLEHKYQPVRRLKTIQQQSSCHQSLIILKLYSWKKVAFCWNTLDGLLIWLRQYINMAFHEFRRKERILRVLSKLFSMRLRNLPHISETLHMSSTLVLLQPKSVCPQYVLFKKQVTVPLFYWILYNVKKSMWGIYFPWTDCKSLAHFEPWKGNRRLQVCLQANLSITWIASKLIIRLPHTQISDTVSTHCFEAVCLY